MEGSFVKMLINLPSSSPLLCVLTTHHRKKQNHRPHCSPPSKSLTRSSPSFASSITGDNIVLYLFHFQRRRPLPLPFSVTTHRRISGPPMLDLLFLLCFIPPTDCTIQPPSPPPTTASTLPHHYRTDNTLFPPSTPL